MKWFFFAQKLNFFWAELYIIKKQEKMETFKVSRPKHRSQLIFNRNKKPLTRYELRV